MPLAELSVTAIATLPARLAVAGELDVSTAPVLLARVRELDTDADRVSLDLREVTFMDSRGMLALLAVQAMLRDREVRLVLAAVSAPVRRVLELTQAWDLFAHGDGHTAAGDVTG